MNGLPRRPVDTPKCAAERDVLAPLAEFARSLAELVLREGLSPYQPPCGIGDPPSTAGTSGGEKSLHAADEEIGEAEKV